MKEALLCIFNGSISSFSSSALISTSICLPIIASCLEHNLCPLCKIEESCSSLILQIICITSILSNNPISAQVFAQPHLASICI